MPGLRTPMRARGQRVVSDLSQDVDGLSRTWTHAGGAPGPGTVDTGPEVSGRLGSRLVRTGSIPLVSRAGSTV